jgi:hypothetical protein
LKPADPRRRLLFPVLFLSLACLLILLLSKSYIMQSDEGHILSAAWQIWNGRKMYDDFQHFFGPGSGYAVYLTWALTGGPSFLAARVLSLVLSFSSVVAVYLMLGGRGIRGPGLAIAVVAWIAADTLYVPINHNSFSAFAAAWLLLLFLRAQERDRDGTGRLVDHLWVGLAAGGVTLFLQTKGLLLLGATAAFTLFAGGGRRGVRAAAVLVAGGVAVIAPLLLIWRPSVLLREWFIVPLSGDYLGHPNASRPLAIACVAATGVVAAIAIRLRDRLLGAIVVTQAALVASVLYNVEVSHVAINCFPLAVFVPLALQRRAARRQQPDAAAAPPDKLSATTTMAIVVGLFAVTMVTPGGRPTWRASTLYVDFIHRTSRNIFPQGKVAAAHAVYAGPFMPGLYFGLGKKNPFFYSETVVCNDQCRRQLLAQIREVRPEIAFLNYEMVRHLRYDADNPVDRYFRDNYVLCPRDDYEGLIVRAVDAGWCP